MEQSAERMAGASVRCGGPLVGSETAAVRYKRPRLVADEPDDADEPPPSLLARVQLFGKRMLGHARRNHPRPLLVAPDQQDELALVQPQLQFLLVEIEPSVDGRDLLFPIPKQPPCCLTFPDHDDLLTN